jgi:hypothetical protein
MVNKKYKMMFTIGLILSLNTLQCFLIDKNVPCKAKMYLMVENQSTNDLLVKFSIDTIAHSTDIKRFSTDSFRINGTASVVDTVYYDWTGVSYCHMNCYRGSNYALFTLSAYRNDSLIYKQDIFPCDSTKQLSLIFCEDCMQEIRDTVKIP